MKKNNSTLIAELGGTNARLGITLNGTSLAESKQYFLSDFTSVVALFDKYFEEINQVVSKAIIGVAAPVIEDEIRFTNNDIKFNQNTLKNKMFPKGLMVLNDLELQAYAIEGLSNHEIIRIGQVQEEKKQSIESTEAPSLEVEEKVLEISRSEAKSKNQRIEFENNSIKGSISLTGSTIDDLTFKKYTETLKGNDQVVLLNPRNLNNGYYIETGWATNSENLDVPNS